MSECPSCFSTLREEYEEQFEPRGAERDQEKNSYLGETLSTEGQDVKSKNGIRTGKVRETLGRRIIRSLDQAIAWADGRDVPVRLTTVRVPVVNVRSVRKKLGLKQWEFANKYGFHTATLRNWEQGRTRPDGPARVLLAVIAKHPEAVEDALRRAG
jgi:putative transcriptional regulator